MKVFCRLRAHLPLADRGLPTKHIVLIVVGVLTISTSAFAQTAADTIERALAGVSVRTRAGAAVIKWNADFTYETLKEGTNSWVCSDESGGPRQQAFAVQCSSGANLKSLEQFMRFQAQSANREEFLALQDAAEADGSLVLFDYGSVVRLLGRPDRVSAQMNTIVTVPGATTESLGLPDHPGQGGAWIMNAGMADAHIMIPEH